MEAEANARREAVVDFQERGALPTHDPQCNPDGYSDQFFHDSVLWMALGHRRKTDRVYDRDLADGTLCLAVLPVD